MYNYVYTVYIIYGYNKYGDYIKCIISNIFADL